MVTTSILNVKLFSFLICHNLASLINGRVCMWHCRTLCLEPTLTLSHKLITVSVPLVTARVQTLPQALHLVWRCRYFIRRLQATARVSTAYRQTRRRRRIFALSGCLRALQRFFAKQQKKLQLCDRIGLRNKAKRLLCRWVHRVIRSYAPLRKQVQRSADLRTKLRVWESWAKASWVQLTNLKADKFLRRVVCRRIRAECLQLWQDAVAQCRRLRSLAKRALKSHLRQCIYEWRDLVRSLGFMSPSGTVNSSSIFFL